MQDSTVCKKLLELKTNANNRKIEFNMSFKHVKKLMTQKYCFFTNTIFDDKSTDEDFRRSVDRKDNTKGYTDENTVACVISFNKKKANLTLDDIEILYDKLIQSKSGLNIRKL